MKPVTIRLAEVCERLGVKKPTFRESYQHLFTDARPPHLRGTTSPRLFFRLEVELACSPGGWERLAQRRAESIRKAGTLKGKKG